MYSIVENMILQYMKYSAKYHVFPYYTFNVISRKIDFLRDSVKSTVVKKYNFKFMAPKK